MFSSCACGSRAYVVGKRAASAVAGKPKHLSRMPKPRHVLSSADDGFCCFQACSSCSVLVVWSQTSVGPKYWIGPG